MYSRRALSAFVALLLPTSLLAQPADDKSFPSRAVTIVVPFAPGGAADSITRIAATRMAGVMGQTFIVDNRPGAAGSLGSTQVAKSAPNGYMLLNVNPGTHGTTPLVQRDVSYDPVNDFTPIAMLGSAVFVLVCNPTLPVKSVKELVAYTKANPGKVRFGSAGIGSNVHFIGEFFKQRTGADMTHVPYRGASPMLNDLMAGTIECTFDSSSKSLITSGKLHALAVTSAKRDPFYPDVPSLEESGVADFDIMSWQALVGPKGIPDEIVQKLNKAANEAMKQPDVAGQMAGIGFRPLTGTPDDMFQTLKRDAARYKEIQRQAKIEMQ